MHVKRVVQPEAEGRFGQVTDREWNGVGRQWQISGARQLQRAFTSGSSATPQIEKCKKLKDL
jgi:hypothetical protein